MLSIPDRYDSKIESAVTILRKKYKEIFILHRLDKQTSGALLFAKNADTHKFLSALFENRRIGKTYTGIVMGKMTDTEGKIEAAIAENPHKKGEMMVAEKGKNAITGYKVVEAYNNYSVVNFVPVTGRTHQIRVHARFINHSLVCDPVYGSGKPVYLSSFKRNFRMGKNEFQERPLLHRLGLHATTISFAGPTGKAYLIEASLPKDMKAMIYQLNKVEGMGEFSAG